MSRIAIPVNEIEFDEGGHTLWVQAPSGTVLRLKTTAPGGITVRKEFINPVSHVDVVTDQPIEVCLVEEAC